MGVKGGKAEPMRGASGNGRSNYFPKFSPDGRWIVFCQASNYMLLQPDSQLYIIPAAGGEARRLGCNLGRMNSWHTWSARRPLAGLLLEGPFDLHAALPGAHG